MQTYTLSPKSRTILAATRMTFGAGEVLLSQWIETNARIVWLEAPDPWKLESLLIRSLPLPLNLDQNDTYPFHNRLSTLRAEARARARALPILQG